jgi:radical SAM superfamily enzyme YgiQ (UPF0313 family)
MSKMKLLLINTPINRHNILGKFDSIYATLKMVPTGLAYLASFVRQNGVEVRILDQYSECLPLDEVFAVIRSFSPDLIGYSATTPNYYAAIDFARKIRKQFPNISSVIGGYHPSAMPDECLCEETIDYVIRDEGEYPLLGLCEAIAGRRNYGDIPGLSYKDFGRFIHNESATNVDLDSLPLPAYDLLPMHLYDSPSYTKFAHPVYQMIASRGCPYRCSFCINAELNGAAKYRKRDIKSVVNEIELLVNKYNARQIQFWDPIFPFGEKHALEFCNELIRRNLHKRIVWNSTTRSELLTEESIKMMVRSGCRGIGFGIESGVSELLEKVNKKMDLDKVRRICKISKENGLIVTAGFILGFPDETREMSQQTIDFAKSLDIHYAQFSIMVPYPGTPLYKNLKRSGEIRDDCKTDYKRYNQNIGMTDLEPIYVPRGRSSAELKEAQRRAYVQFYLRPRMVWLHLPHLRFSKLVGMLRSLKAIASLLFKRKRYA